MVERVKKEVEIHCTLRHPSVLEVSTFTSHQMFHLVICIQLYSFFEDTNQVYLVLEMCHNGTLNDYIKTTQLQEYEGDYQFNFICITIAAV